MSFLGIADIIGTAMTNNENHNQAVYNRKFQKEENEKTREYNLQLAKMQNGWNIQQWNRENAYNHPAAQKARLESAGLNADMMYGGTGVSNISASSPEMTGGAPASYQDWSGFTPRYMVPHFDNPVSNYLDTQLKQAQINKLNSETEGQDIQNEILTSDAKFRDAWNQSHLDTQYSEIALNGSKQELNDQQIKESQSRIMQINAEVQSIYENINEIRNRIKNDNIRVNLEKQLNDSTIKKIASECKLNYAEAESIVKQVGKILRQYDDNHELSIGQQGSLRITTDNARMYGKMTYGSYDSSLSVWENTLKFVKQVVSTISPFKN